MAKAETSPQDIQNGVSELMEARLRTIPEKLVPTSVAFREAIYHNGKGSITAAEGVLELHPAGVLVQAKGRERVLVPFSNVKWLGVEEVKKP